MPRQGIRARLRNRLTDRRTNRVLARHAIEREFGDGDKGPWSTPRSWKLLNEFLKAREAGNVVAADEIAFTAEHERLHAAVLHKRLFAEALLRGDVHFKEGE